MTGVLSSYLVAVGAMLFAACSGLTLIYAINHVDPSNAELTPGDGSKRVAA